MAGIAPPHPVSYLLLENLAFLAVSTLFLATVGYLWRGLKPFSLPEPLPSWFALWFGSVQFLGGVVPAIALIWGIWQGSAPVLLALIPYLVVLVLQVLTESIAIRQAKSVVWVMVPYLYVPYRIWQLWEGWLWLDGAASTWLGWLLAFEAVVWLANYLLDLAQLPRLLQWPQDP
ncbi:MAG: hypothetical protein WBA10_02325 [Elainellaceae cyanobacterium]